MRDRFELSLPERGAEAVLLWRVGEAVVILREVDDVDEAVEEITGANTETVVVVAGEVVVFLTELEVVEEQYVDVVVIADVGIENVSLPIVGVKHSMLQDIVDCSNEEQMLGEVVSITLCSASEAALDPRD